MGGEDNSLPRQSGGQVGGEVLQKIRRGGRNQGKGLVFRQIQLQELEGEPLQPLALGKNIVRGVGLLLWGESTPAQQVRIPQDGGHRGFELVGKAPDEAVLSLHGGLERGKIGLLAGGHGVKFPGQRPQLVLGLYSAAAGQVPGGQRLGGLGELVQGAGKKPGDTVRQAGAHHKEDGENLSVGLLLLLAGLIDGGDVVGHIENQGFPLNLQLAGQLEILLASIGEGRLGVVRLIHLLPQV